jgi:hypothetical protein
MICISCDRGRLLPAGVLAIESEVRLGDSACRMARPGRLRGCAGLRGGRRRCCAWPCWAGGRAVRLAFGQRLAPRTRAGLFAGASLALGGAIAILFMTAIGLSAFWVVDTPSVFLVWQKLVFVLGLFASRDSPWGVAAAIAH